MRVGLDSNILIYFEGLARRPEDRTKEIRARGLVEALPASALAIPAQVLGETFRVLVHKQGLPRTEARRRLSAWPAAATILPTLAEDMETALDLAAAHQLQVWDALILAVASRDGCPVLLSEDYQDGFQFGGTTVVNPFTTPAHPLLTALLPDGPIP